MRLFDESECKREACVECANIYLQQRINTNWYFDVRKGEWNGNRIMGVGGGGCR